MELSFKYCIIPPYKGKHHLTPKPPTEIELTIKKLIFGGQALAETGGKTYLVWNALPGERVRARILKKKAGIFDAVAVEILEASPERLAPLEPHYLACSPWQVLSPNAEKEWKLKIAAEAYQRLGDVRSPSLLTMESDDEKPYGYRNKMEYNLTDSEGLKLAFFERDTHRRVAAKPCLLADPAINQTAEYLLDWLRREKIAATCLKTMIVRANERGQSLAGLFIMEDLKFSSLPPLPEYCKGLQIYYSDPKSPASVPNKLLASQGDDFLIATLGNARLKFGLLSFFQINIALFRKTLDEIARFTDPSKSFTDFYSGVGAIGLSLHGRYSKCVLVDSNDEAIRYAKENIAANGFDNCNAVLAPAEKVTQAIVPDTILMLDPPRAGLHDNVIQKILQEKPIRVLYLSCNPSTHARDLKLLSPAYELKELKIYNFFPRTPHIESLAVLDRK